MGRAIRNTDDMAGTEASSSNPRRRYRRATTREEVAYRKAIGSVLGLLALPLLVLAILGGDALFGPAAGRWIIRASGFGFVVVIIWLEWRVGSRKDQPRNGWSGSWLDKPPYQPERRKSRWW